MKYQSLFSGKNKKNITDVLSTAFTQRNLLKVKEGY